MIGRIHLVIYFKMHGDEVMFRRAYKFVNQPKDLTPKFSHFLYSHKSQKYHPTNFYFLGWEGKQIDLPIGENLKTIRHELMRIGLDLL